MDKIYGPYQRKDKRWFLIINGKTISYPKWLYQNHHNIILSNQETIDHIDGNPDNNRITNLQILTRSENIRKSKKERQTTTFVCPQCKQEVTKWTNYILGNLRKKKSGPYCSRHCAGIASHTTVLAP